MCWCYRGNFGDSDGGGDLSGSGISDGVTGGGKVSVVVFSEIGQKQ